ncbi:hypothetical protein [Aliiglaciecola lipolytica]|uniref:Uncharacterized protein n=1 Tax=Aliiglaciecola lipolytica E3 TaxID=1127673 RepID=K6X1T1_9ALTE|nr:hypothetical protein [Aliiglaciecola lipolytica]GAC14619.1 hypothetical protein GLIP_1991 [Aliiglaciecola lipolytica E3]
MGDQKPHDSERIVDEQISGIYQAQDKQVPSEAVDKQILSLANQKLKIKVGSTPSTWRKWQWPTSIAASVMFITLVVYTQYEQFDPRFEQMPSAPIDTFDIADQATVDETQQAQKAKLETRDLNSPNVSQRMASAPLPDHDSFHEQKVVEPERARYAEKEALSLASKAMESVEIETLSLDLETSSDVNVDQQMPAYIALSNEEAQQLAAEEQQKNAVLLARQKAEENERKKAMSLSSAKLMAREPNELYSTSKMQVNTEYLDNLLIKLKEQTKSVTTGTADNPIAHKLQTDIYDYLLLLQIADPAIQIDQKYLQVLTEKQKTKLNQ